MNTQLKHVYPDMKQMTVSTHLLGDQQGLRQAWERDGYWFFRDVLDQAAIARARQRVLDHLDEIGVADRHDPMARCRVTAAENPKLAALQGYDRAALEGLAKTKVVETTIMSDPKINAFFERLWGCPPYWIPFTQYRASPPTQDRSKSRFDLIHYDAMHNKSLPFTICWIPLVEIDFSMGGIAVAEGLHDPPLPFKKEGLKIVPLSEDEHVLRIDDRSYCRDLVAVQILRPQLAEKLPVGTDVIITVKRDTVVNMRPQH